MSPLPPVAGEQLIPYRACRDLVRWILRRSNLGVVSQLDRTSPGQLAFHLIPRYIGIDLDSRGLPETTRRVRLLIWDPYFSSTTVLVGRYATAVQRLHLID